MLKRVLESPTSSKLARYLYDKNIFVRIVFPEFKWFRRIYSGVWKRVIFQNNPHYDWLPEEKIPLVFFFDLETEEYKIKMSYTYGELLAKMK